MSFNPLYCGCEGVPSGYQTPRIAPSGWNFGQGCDPCANPGPCPIQLDFNCIIYHKNNDQINNLTPIGLNNGATLQLFADTVAALLGQLDVPDYNLPCLRATYTITNIEQFAQSVDTQLCLLSAAIAAASVPITPVPSPSVLLSVSGTLDHTLQADVKISATSGNRVSILSDGIYGTPQTLSIDYTAKTMTIVGGNTVSLSSLTCGVGGFLGNVTADPTGVIDGQYWFRTDLSAAVGLRIQLNGSVRTITTS